MTGRYVFTNSELVAYLDGACDPRQARRIEAALLEDRDLAERLSLLDVPLLDLQSELHGMLLNTPPMPPLDVEPASQGFRAASWVLAAAICLTVGGTVGYGLRGEMHEDWRDLVAAYQVMYVPETLAIETFDHKAAATKLANLGEAIGVDLLPAQGIDLLQFRRAQMLGYEGQPVVQIAFLSPEGAPVALCVTRLDHDETTPIVSHVMRGMSSASWSENGYGYLLIGGQNHAVIDLAAAKFRDML